MNEPLIAQGSERWEQRRSELRHDWLKNHMLHALDAFLQRLEAPEASDARLREFIEMDLFTWEQRRGEIRRIISSFESTMSPRVLLERPPLDRLDPDTRARLADLTDKLWHARYPVDRWQEDADRDLTTADGAYFALCSELKGAEPLGRPRLQALRPLFLSFRNAIAELGNSLSAFPRRILVT